MPIGIGNYIFLLENGELNSLEDVVQHQHTNGSLYGTALYPNVYPYKLSIYEYVRPKIVVIGSSRTLQFRQEQFSQPFVNLGLTVNYFKEAEKLIDDILAIHKPDIVLFGIDFWWANPKSKTAFNFATHEIRGGELNPHALIAPTKWLIENKISQNAYFKALTKASDGKVIEHLGVQARHKGIGFGPDGSKYYLYYVYGRSPAPSENFGETLPRIEQSTSQFIYGQEISQERIDSLRRSIKKLEKQGIKVISFLPSLAPTILEAMENKGDKYAYIPKFRQHLIKLHQRHMDFHDPRTIGSDDCEFVDGFHGGDVLMSRMLLEMTKAFPDILAGYTNVKHLKKHVSDYAGHATFDHRYKQGGEIEIDFLNIGCRKK